ncbi:unnamed protein product [Macrosiphum euphorbiae]|uniref:Uncharacterized protein n=1 Tax=Macrosiphum euphorbiae TaxID=13131 RepID=A0AAV0WA50_9HEMI|nr:unnamed protein product [Macrosiphum euphorbiae]
MQKIFVFHGKYLSTSIVNVKDLLLGITKKLIVTTDRRLSITEDSFKVKVFYPALDTALFELKERFKGLKTISDEFSFLKPINLTTIEEQIIIKASYDLHIKLLGPILVFAHGPPMAYLRH